MLLLSAYYMRYHKNQYKHVHTDLLMPYRERAYLAAIATLLK